MQKSGQVPKSCLGGYTQLWVPFLTLCGTNFRSAVCNREDSSIQFITILMVTLSENAWTCSVEGKRDLQHLTPFLLLLLAQNTPQYNVVAWGGKSGSGGGDIDLKSSDSWQQTQPGL